MPAKDKGNRCSCRCFSEITTPVTLPKAPCSTVPLTWSDNLQTLMIVSYYQIQIFRVYYAELPLSGIADSVTPDTARRSASLCWSIVSSTFCHTILNHISHCVCAPQVGTPTLTSDIIGMDQKIFQYSVTSSPEWCTTSL